MAGILTVNRHMDNGTHMMAVVPTGTHGIHQLRISNGHHALIHMSRNALTCNLFHLTDMTAIDSLVREGITQGSTDGMRREVLHMSGQMQQLVLVKLVRMYSLHGKLPVRQRPRLVKHQGLHLRKHVHIVGTLDQNTLPRGSANASEEGQRHTEHKGTGTRHHQKQQGAVEPGRESGEERGLRRERYEYWRNDSQGHCGKDHNGCIDTGKTGDERLALRLMFTGMFHQTDNLRHRALTESLRGTHADDS